MGLILFLKTTIKKPLRDQTERRSETTFGKSLRRQIGLSGSKWKRVELNLVLRPTLRAPRREQIALRA